jgi:hypothetical protein
VFSLLAVPLFAQVKEEITVTAKTDDTTGVADSASESVVPQQWISAHAEQRAGSVLEAVPGGSSASTAARKSESVLLARDRSRSRN